MLPPDRGSRRRTGSSAPPRRRAGTARPLAVAARAPGTGLRGLLRAIDGGPFQSYKRIVGEHELGEFTLEVVSVPPDPLGGPARLRLSIDAARAGLEGAWCRDDLSRLVIGDEVVRAGTRAIESLSGPSAGSAPGSGRVWVDAPGPELARRTSASVSDARIELALAFDLPAADRRVRGHQAEAILFEHLPRVGMSALLFPMRRVDDAKRRIREAALRVAATAALAARGLAALVPPSALRRRIAAPLAMTTLETPLGSVEGLAVPTGITIFAVPGLAGAGPWLRELIAESGTEVARTAILGGRAWVLRSSRRAFGPLDLRAFIRPCAEVPDPASFATEAADAPLALAGSLLEAMEAGARIFVLDDDEIPSGALGPDRRMRELTGGSTPLGSLPERLRTLCDRWGLSFLIATRAMEAWVEVADSVFVVRDDRIEDLTRPPAKSAPRLAVDRPAARDLRVVVDGPPSRLKVSTWGDRGVRIGDDLVDLRDTTVHGDPARLRAVAALLKQAALLAPTWRPVEEVLDALEGATAGPQLDRLEEPGLVDLTAPSRGAIASALARWKRVGFRVVAGRLAAASEDTR